MANEPVNIFEYEAIAREKLDQGHYHFIAGAATDEITLRRTRARQHPDSPEDADRHQPARSLRWTRSVGQDRGGIRREYRCSCQ